MPSYIKFLKGILAKKRKINDFETVALTQTTSDVFKNGVPKKMTDLGSFIVSCSIGGMDLGRALYKLGASINLMYLFIFKKLRIEEVQSSHMRLSFADRSFAKLEEKIEDVLVKVDKFLFSADFVILDYEADRKEIKFNVVNVKKFPADVENCSMIESLRGTIATKKSIISCLALRNSLRKIN
ncbi:uncharacterized protein E5676_scaffold562G00080 [Cucumis melo var. makuwa]|uniref:Uncharacterized protein n=1 Tax=Cucumis melo var. makuwa TaxID=1194695 RepID=A0A5D3BKH1_CUCMM|nr:uncharacterized protein E5676_scaffold562G00080 [Cucumis melo var. makuwa]